MFSLPEPKDNLVIEFNFSIHKVQDIVDKLISANNLIAENRITCNIQLYVSTYELSSLFARLTIEGEVNGDTVSMVYNLEQSKKDKFITVDLSKFDRRK